MSRTDKKLLKKEGMETSRHRNVKMPFQNNNGMLLSRLLWIEENKTEVRQRVIIISRKLAKFV